MKKSLVALSCMLLAAAITYAARGGSEAVQTRELQSYENTGFGTTKWQLILIQSSTTVASVMLPSSVTGFKLRPITYVVQFEVDKDTTSSLAVVNAEKLYVANSKLISSSFTAGGFAMGDVTENRLLPSGTTRYLHLMPLTEGTTVRLELY